MHINVLDVRRVDTAISCCWYWCFILCKNQLFSVFAVLWPLLVILLNEFGGLRHSYLVIFSILAYSLGFLSWYIQISWCILYLAMYTRFEIRFSSSWLIPIFFHCVIEKIPKNKKKETKLNPIHLHAIDFHVFMHGKHAEKTFIYVDCGWRTILYIMRYRTLPFFLNVCLPFLFIEDNRYKMTWRSEERHPMHIICINRSIQHYAFSVQLG